MPTLKKHKRQPRHLPPSETRNVKRFDLEEIDAYMKAYIDDCFRKSGKRGGPQKTPEEVIQLRRKAIIQRMRDGMSPVQIKYDIAEKWDVAYQTAYNYYRDAVEYLNADLKEDAARVRENQVERLYRIAEEALAQGDRKSALATYDQINKIYGLYSQKVELNNDTPLIEFKFGE